MKKILFALLLFCSTTAIAQNGSFTNLQTLRLYLAGKKLIGVSQDSTRTFGFGDSLMTDRAIRALIRTSIGEAGAAATLDQITTTGNTTLNDIKIGQLFLWDVPNGDYAKIFMADNQFLVKTFDDNFVFEVDGQVLRVANDPTSSSWTFDGGNVDHDVRLDIPNTDLTSPVIPVEIEGAEANDNGQLEFTEVGIGFAGASPDNAPLHVINTTEAMVAVFEGSSGQKMYVRCVDETLATGSYPAPRGSIGNGGGTLQVKFGDDDDKWADVVYSKQDAPFPNIHFKREVFNGIDMTAGNYNIQALGVYRIDETSPTDTLILPDPADFAGGEIFIVNRMMITNPGGVDQTPLKDTNGNGPIGQWSGTQQMVLPDDMYLNHLISDGEYWLWINHN